MSKTLSFRGIIDQGLEERIKLSTKDGKTGYKVTKFQIMTESPGSQHYETLVSIFSKAQGSGKTLVDFSEADLIGAAYIEDNHSYNNPMSEAIIFDNQIFNQDIFVSTASLTGTERTNYYIELEKIALTDIQATQLTLQSLRTIASR